MCGGNYNLRKDDDFTLRNGTVLNKKDSNQFGNNWAILSGTLMNRLCNVIIFPGYLLFFLYFLFCYIWIYSFLVFALVK